VGYRHFDTSTHNDRAIGNVIKKWLDVGKVKREELFIVSKVIAIMMMHDAYFTEDELY
jgi:diketogulonate reductase-like aldo/keto reductase